jgi:hypothetical protein
LINASKIVLAGTVAISISGSAALSSSAFAEEHFYPYNVYSPSMSPDIDVFVNWATAAGSTFIDTGSIGASFDHGAAYGTGYPRSYSYGYGYRVYPAWHAAHHHYHRRHTAHRGPM